MPNLLIISVIGMIVFGGSLYIFIRLIIKESEKLNKKGEDSSTVKILKKLKTY